MNLQLKPSRLIPLGNVVITSNARNLLTDAEIVVGLTRHAAGDWGDICPDDALANEEALVEGDRLLSSYGEGERCFWIITEHDRSVTTVLLPSDY